MKAQLILRERTVVASNRFIERVIWQVPEPVPPTTHGFKYRLVYIVDGVRVVGYDNERGKGDHRHIGSNEYAYVFTDVRRLIADFNADIARWNDGYRNS